MIIGNRTVRRIIQEGIDEPMPIEDKAIYFITLKIEEHIRNLSKLAIKLHHERNKIRKNQGLPVKKRLSEEVFKEVLKNNEI